LIEGDQKYRTYAWGVNRLKGGFCCFPKKKPNPHGGKKEKRPKNKKKRCNPQPPDQQNPSEK